MKPTDALGFVLGPNIFFVIGCQQLQNQITGKPDDVSVSVFADDVVPDEIQTGTVVIDNAVEE